MSENDCACIRPSTAKEHFKMTTCLTHMNNTTFYANVHSTFDLFGTFGFDYVVFDVLCAVVPR